MKLKTLWWLLPKGAEVVMFVMVWSSYEKIRSIKVGFWLGLVCVGLWTYWNKKASCVAARNSEAQWLDKCGVDRLSQFIVGKLKSPSISNFPPIKEVFRINWLRSLLFLDVLFGDLYRHKICKEVLLLNSIFAASVFMKIFHVCQITSSIYVSFSINSNTSVTIRIIDIWEAVITIYLNLAFFNFQ